MAAVNTVVTPAAPGANTARIQVTLPPSSNITQVVIVIKDKNNDPTEKVVVDVKPGDELVIRELADLPANYEVITYTANLAGVSVDKFLNANVNKNQTILRLSKSGTPVLAGKQIAKPVFFAADSPKLRKQELASLNRVIRYAKSNIGRVLVTGFVSHAGKSISVEQALSNQRALAVATYLSKHGVNCWIDYSGFGSVAKSSNPANRKVEIRWTNNLKPLKN